MTEFKAYGVQWGNMLPLQGWVVGTSEVEGVAQQLIQTIRTAPDVETLKNELGIDQTDKDWQVRASAEGPWTLTWVGMVDNVHPYEGEIKTVISRALLIDPHLGIPVDRYWGADEYRTALPELIWKFNPWTGKYRKPEDMENDPYGLLI